jgi:transposase
MHKAISYILDRWPALTAYTTRGDLPIDNNQAERVLRPIVIGRKNWYFVGSEDATAWAATNFTLFESCRLAKVEPRAWLRAVIARIHAGDRDYAAMTPAAYAAKGSATD